MDNGIQGGLQIPAGHGEQIHTFPVKLRKNGQVSFVDSGALPSPQVQIGKTVFAATLAAVEKKTVIFGFGRQM